MLPTLQELRVGSREINQSTIVVGSVNGCDAGVFREACESTNGELCMCLCKGQGVQQNLPLEALSGLYTS